MGKWLKRLGLAGAGLVLLAILGLWGLYYWHEFFMVDMAPGDWERAGVTRHHLHWAGAGGWDISYLSSGPKDAPRLILCHGTPGDARAWKHYLVEHRPGRQVIAYDRPGFGQTRPEKGLASLEAQARALEPFLVKAGGAWPVLAGHSLGGPIVLWAAALYPERVGAVVILAGSVDPALEHPAWWQRVGQWPLVPWLLPRPLMISSLEVVNLRQELEGLAPLLGRITCPVFILHGTDDDLVPESNVDYLTPRLTGSREVEVRVLKGQDHFLIWNNTPVVDQALDGALRAAAGQGRGEGGG